MPKRQTAQITVIGIGIVREDYAPGAGLCPGVRAALAEAARMIEDEVHSLI